MYVIRLRNCAFFARHGVRREEKTLGQRFYVDAELTIDPGGGLETDSVKETVDYAAAYKVIEEIVTGRRRYLIEALALDVARTLCERFPPLVSATITVRKPNAPVPGVLDSVEVTVVWPQ